MVYSLAWLPDALLGAGLKVAPVDGWEIRGRGDVGRTLGILCHHTAGPKIGNMPSLDTIIHGRPDLNGHQLSRGGSRMAKGIEDGHAGAHQRSCSIH